MKLSPTQLRVLRYASEGRLVEYWSTVHGGDRAFVSGAPDITVRGATVDKMLALGLIRFRAGMQPSQSTRSRTFEVTPKGAALLEEGA